MDSKIDRYVSIISRLYLMSVEDRVNGVSTSLEVGVREDGIVVLQGSLLQRRHPDEDLVRYGYVRPRQPPLVVLRHAVSGKEIVNRLVEFLPLLGFELNKLPKHGRRKERLDVMYNHKPVLLFTHFGALTGYD